MACRDDRAVPCLGEHAGRPVVQVSNGCRSGVVPGRTIARSAACGHSDRHSVHKLEGTAPAGAGMEIDPGVICLRPEKVGVLTPRRR